MKEVTKLVRILNFPTCIKRLVGTIITFLAVGLVVLNAWFYFLQPGMLFYPYKTLDALPSDWGLSYENVAITTSDNIQLHGWYLPNKKSKQVILFFHGNGGNISHRGDSLKIFHALGVNILIIDYRGYGLSKGELSEQGIYQDARAAWQYLQEKLGYKTSDIIIFGRSLGGAVATKLASEVKPRALILESTFSSVRDMASRALPVVSNLIYLRFGFNTEAAIKRVTVPVLVLHSPEDEIIPYTLGLKVFNNANKPRYFYQLRGGHNDGFIESMPGYQQTLRAFMQSL